MKNKILFSVLAVLGVILITGTSFYLLNQNKPADNSAESTAGETTGDLLENQPQPKTEVPKNDQPAVPQLSNKLVTDDFEMSIPEGWIKADPVAGTSAMAVNANESINDSAAQKIGFKSYLTVSRDTFPGTSLADYLGAVQDELRKVFSDAVFSNEQDTIINGQSARAMEIELSRQGMSFKVLFVLVRGKGDDVWAISFNTAKSAWDGYKETFQSAANSFKLKM